MTVGTTLPAARCVRGFQHVERKKNAPPIFAGEKTGIRWSGVTISSSLPKSTEAAVDDTYGESPLATKLQAVLAIRMEVPTESPPRFDRCR